MLSEIVDFFFWGEDSWQYNGIFMFTFSFKDHWADLIKMAMQCHSYAASSEWYLIAYENATLTLYCCLTVTFYCCNRLRVVLYWIFTVNDHWHIQCHLLTYLFSLGLWGYARAAGWKNNLTILVFILLFWLVDWYKRGG